MSDGGVARKEKRRNVMRVEEKKKEGKKREKGEYSGIWGGLLIRGIRQD